MGSETNIQSGEYLGSTSVTGIDYNSIFGSNESSSQSWWQDVWDSVAGTGGISGLATGLMQWYALDQNQNQYDATREDSQASLAQQQANWEKSFELQQQQLALQQEQQALEQAKLDDKIATRKAHNTSINKPSTAAKTVRFG